MSDIQVSERAAKRIGQILGAETAGAMLRVSVEGGGCSGFQYRFDIERAKGADDIVIEREGAVVLIDSVSAPFLAGSEIDFVDHLSAPRSRCTIQTRPRPADAARALRFDGIVVGQFAFM